MARIIKLSLALCITVSSSFAIAKKKGSFGGSGDFLTPEKSRSALPQFDKSLFEASQQTPKKIDPKALGPSIKYQAIKSENEDYNAYNAILDQQINELKKLINRTKSSNASGDLLLRLAGLYVEKADLVKTIIDQKYDQQIAKLREQNPNAPPPPINYSSAQSFNKTAIQLYERFLKEFPNDSKADQALFFLGYNYFELGEAKKGLAFYQRLANAFPSSSFIVESRFALGEYYFENNKFNEALSHYQFVMKSKNRKLATFSSYKVAWCHFKLADYKAAIIGLERIIKSAKRTQKSSVELRLDGEARRDIILFYVEAGDAAKAPRYFNALLGEAESFSYLEKLAYVYADRGDRESAKELFQYLSSQRPDHPKSFDYQYQIVRMYSTSKDTEVFKTEIWNWIKNYGPKSSWFEQNKGNKELVEKATMLQEQTLRIWVLQQHQTAQNSRGEFSQKMALSGYRLYFSAFGNSSHTPELRFFYGELLYDMKKFDEASKEYRWVVENGGTSKYRNQAAANILVAVEKSIPSDSEISKKVGDQLEPVEMGSAVDNYIVQAIWFLKNFPEDKKAAETQFRIGRIFYQHNFFDKAIPYFRVVINDYPTTKYAEYSANLLLDIYNLRQDFDGIVKISKELLGVPTIARSSAGREIREVLQKANFKRAQDMEGKGDFIASALNYEKFIQENPNAEIASLAYFNAAVNYTKAGMPGKAATLLQTLSQRKDPRAVELRPKVVSIMPSLYRDSGQLEKAAIAHIQAAGASMTPSDQANHFYNAGVLYEVLDQRSKAISNFTEYYELAKGKEKSATLFNIAQLYRKNDQRQKAVEYYDRFLNESFGVSNQSVESAFWLFSLSRNRQEKDKWAQTTIRLYNQLKSDQKLVSARFPAMVELEKLKSLYAELWAIKLDSLQRLKELSSKKISVIDSINQKAAQIVKYNSPEEILEAVKIVGDSNLNLYDSLVSSPVPPELTTPEKIKEYRDTVKSQLADPFFAKAIEAYELVLQRSSEFEAYSDFTKEARRQLVKLKPGSQYEFGQVAFELHSADWMGL